MNYGGIYGTVISLEVYKKEWKQKVMPKINIQDTGSIYADLNSPKSKSSILLMTPKCTIIGLHNLPYCLFTTPDFNETILTPHLRENIYEIKELILQPSFSNEFHNSITYDSIPKWLTNFKKLEVVRFNYIELDDLDVLHDLPIEYLTIRNIKYNDNQKLIGAIKQFKDLKELSYDHSLPTELVQSLRKTNLKLTLVAD